VLTCSSGRMRCTLTLIEIGPPLLCPAPPTDGGNLQHSEGGIVLMTRNRLPETPTDPNPSLWGPEAVSRSTILAARARKRTMTARPTGYPGNIA
jgi:hypothetical protein